MKLLRVTKDWECPNCSVTDQTHEAQPHSRFHTCQGLRGLTAPLVPKGTDCKVVAHDREDYVAKEDVQTDRDGRPAMSVVTTRDDGEDVIVFAPTAHVRV